MRKFLLFIIVCAFSLALIALGYFSARQKALAEEVPIVVLIEAQLGYAEQQHVLGLIYYMRFVEEKVGSQSLDISKSENKKQALYWLNRAHGNGHPLSKKVIKRM